MPKHLSIDIETYSDIDIGKCGLFKYCDSEAFEILLFAYSYDFGPVKVVDLASGQAIPGNVQMDLQNPDVIKHAYNAAFEITCLNRAGYLTPADQWRCTMLHGLYLGYPAGLANLGKALGLPDDKQKMAAGKALIRYFCVPCKATKRNGNRRRNLPKHDPDKWRTFKEYNAQDVVTEMADYQRLLAYPVPDWVQEDWVIDYELNRRGIQLDLDLVYGAIRINDEHREELIQRAIAITGLSNPNSRNQLLEWLNENTDLNLEKLTKETVSESLQVASGAAEEVLRIRKNLSKSSVSKYQAMKSAVCHDHRIRGVLQFYGANRTGRWAGRLVQVQNLPHDVPPAIGVARHLAKTGNRHGLELLYGDVASTLSQLIRTAFIAPDDAMLCVSDFSAIEARVLSWLADEKWRMDVFANNGDIYCASASSMFGVPVVKHGINGHLRQKGKVAELALGYQGGPNALISMGALKMGLTEEELPDIVRRWRASNPRIQDFWYAVDNAALSVMHNAQPVGLPHGIIFSRECNLVYGYDYLTITLPSGRRLFYPQPYIADNQFGRPAIHYRTQIGANWVSTSTYGGKLVENITQAIARDCLALAINRLVQHGYKPLMHIHDEVVLEVPRESLHDDEIDRINAIMCAPIPWAPGLLLNADGFISPYYKKD